MKTQTRRGPHPGVQKPLEKAVGAAMKRARKSIYEAKWVEGEDGKGAEGNTLHCILGTSLLHKALVA